MWQILQILTDCVSNLYTFYSASLLYKETQTHIMSQRCKKIFELILKCNFNSTDTEAFSIMCIETVIVFRIE